MTVDDFMRIGITPGMIGGYRLNNGISACLDYQLDDCLEARDFKQIIHDKDLFWLAFCKALSLSQERGQDRFSVEASHGKINISGTEDVILGTRGLIEKLRQFLQEGHTEIFVVSAPLETVYLEKESFIIDVSGYDFCNDYLHHYYAIYVKPALPRLAEFLGAIYTEEKRQAMIQEFKDRLPVSRLTEVIRFDW